MDETTRWILVLALFAFLPYTIYRLKEGEVFKTYTLVLNSILALFLMYSITFLIGVFMKKSFLEIDYPLFCLWFRMLHIPVDLYLSYLLYKWMVTKNVINKR